MALALCGLAGCVHAGEPDDDQWRYRIGAGDTLTALAGTYLQPPHTWPDLHKLNQLADPHRLAPGATLRIPVAWLKREAAVAEVVFVRGDCFVQPAGAAQPVAARAGSMLEVGAALRTAGDASMVLRFADGSRLMLTPGTQILLEQLLTFGRSGLARSAVTLERGSVETQVPARAQPVRAFEIRTPTATLGVRGTEFRAHAAPQSEAQPATSRVEVLGGSVAAAAGARDVLVKTGFGAVAPAGSGMSDPRALLPAPRLAEGGLRAQQVPPSIEWTPVAGAQAYRIQLFADAAAAQLLADQRVGAPAAAWPALADGSYHLRVRAVAADGLEGLNAASPLIVARAPEPPPPGPPPPLPASPADGDNVTGDTVVLAWTATGPVARYRLQVSASPRFDVPQRDLVDLGPGAYNLVQHRLALAPGRYHWRVAGVSAAGAVGPFGPARSFELRPAVQR